MKLSKAVLGAVLVGITVQATSCTKGDEAKPKEKTSKETSKKTPDNCPACGMG